jgi:multisubunit Na+/H+ antiporter MnhG subunit
MPGRWRSIRAKVSSGTPKLRDKYERAAAAVLLSMLALLIVCLAISGRGPVVVVAVAVVIALIAWIQHPLLAARLRERRAGRRRN